MQNLDCKFEVKALDEAKGEFTGWASVYDVVDLGGDIVKPGAFTRTLKANAGEVPLLWSHDPMRPIGSASLEEGDKGLQVHGKLQLEIPMAADVYKLMRPLEGFKKPAIRGLSFGYDAVKHTWEEEESASSRQPKKTYRVLQEVKLYEVSPVCFPMNPKAVIQSVKAGENGEAAAAIHCSKEVFATIDDAKTWCVSRGYRTATASDTEDAFTFMQRNVETFKPDTLHEVTLQLGVKADMGQLTQVIQDEYSSLMVSLDTLRRDFDEFKATLVEQGIVDDPVLHHSLKDLQEMGLGAEGNDPPIGDANDPDGEARHSFDSLIRDMKQAFERYQSNG